MQRVLVMGASGNIGTTLLKQLHGCGMVPVAALRDGAARSKIPAGCEYRICGYGNAKQAASALAETGGLFLLVPFHEEMVSWGEQLVAEAKRRRVDFIVRVSGLAAAPDCASKMGALHGQIDQAVKESGIDYCILRCNSFMQNFSGIYQKMIQRYRVISLPEADAQSCFIDTADIAAVTARIFSEPAKHVNQVYDLSGPKPLSNSKVAAIISDVTDNIVRYQPVSDEEAERSYRKMGISPWRIEVLTSLSRFIRAGNAGKATETVT
ncbi:MAG: NmrA family NAD(P)-binding protein, partial [Pseudomonadales bacterium]